MGEVLRVGIVGPLLGANAGWVTSQGEVLAEHLTRDGVTVHTASAVVGRAGRAADTASEPTTPNAAASVAVATPV